MGLDNIVNSDSGNDNDKSGSPSKTQIVFWDQPGAKGYSGAGAEDVEQAYYLAKGSGKLRNTFDGATIDEDHSWEDLHQFTAELLVGVDSLIFEGSAADVMDTLMLDAEDIAEYLDEQPEVKAELVRALNEQHGAKAEADD